MSFELLEKDYSPEKISLDQFWNKVQSEELSQKKESQIWRWATLCLMACLISIKANQEMKFVGFQKKKSSFVVLQKERPQTPLIEKETSDNMVKMFWVLNKNPKTQHLKH